MRLLMLEGGAAASVGRRCGCWCWEEVQPAREGGSGAT